MKTEPRIAFFTDSFTEVNGVAHTSRMLAAFAKQRELPFLCVYAGDEIRQLEDGSLKRLVLPRTRFGFRLDADLRFDLLMMRHAWLVLKTVRAFKPDVIHITGPSDIGLLGVYVAKRLGVPMVLSWHTNIHEYAGERIAEFLNRHMPVLSDSSRVSMAGSTLRLTLKWTQLFYRFGKILLAPNEELRSMLECKCERPTFLMQRGVNTEAFSPAKRDSKKQLFTIGYVGRLTPEKNVRLLATIEKGLLATKGNGQPSFRFVIVGAGSEGGWLQQNMQTAEFTGVLKGEALQRAYANVDLFVFPSHTDTFGNVVLEAQASGVPAIVSNQGGPKFIINEGETGLVAKNDKDFLRATLRLMSQPELLAQMSAASRRLAGHVSWDTVFEQVYLAYETCLQRVTAQRALLNSRHTTRATMKPEKAR